MHAARGDRLVIKGHHVGDPDRDAEILEIKAADGAPPWLVRWSDDGHEGPSSRVPTRRSSTSKFTVGGLRRNSAGPTEAPSHGNSPDVEV